MLRLRQILDGEIEIDLCQPRTLLRTVPAMSLPYPQAAGTPVEPPVSQWPTASLLASAQSLCRRCTVELLHFYIHHLYFLFVELPPAEVVEESARETCDEPGRDVCTSVRARFHNTWRMHIVTVDCMCVRLFVTLAHGSCHRFVQTSNISCASLPSQCGVPVSPYAICVTPRHHTRSGTASTRRRARGRADGARRGLARRPM